MEKPSLPKSPKIRFTFNQSKDHYALPRRFSPAYESARLGSPILQVSRNSNPNYSSLIQSPETNLIDELIFQCRRIKPDFNINPELSNYSSSVMQAIRKSVDLIVDSQTKDWGYELQVCREKVAELTFLLEEANKKNKFLAESEKKISLREEKLAIDEVKVMTEKKMIQNEKNNIQAMKKHYLQLEHDVKNLKEDLKSEKSLNKQKEARIHELFNENLEKETMIEEIKNSTDTDSFKLKTLENQMKLEREKIAREKEEIAKKFQIFQKEKEEIEKKKQQLNDQLDLSTDLNKKLNEELTFFDENKKEMNDLRISLEFEQAKVKESKKNIENDKLEIANMKKSLEGQKLVLQQEFEKLIKEKEDFKAKISKLKDQNFDLSEMNDLENGSNVEMKNSQEPTEYFPHLKACLIDFSAEIFSKKVFLEKWLQNLHERELSMDTLLSDIKILCTLLERTQFETEEIETQPDLDPLLEVIHDYLNDINEKKSRIQQEFSEFVDQGFENEQFSAEFSIKSTDSIIAMLSEFENQAVELKEFEFSLQVFRDQLEKQAEENSTIAEFLKEERISFEREKMEKTEEIEQAAKGLSSLQQKLENTIEIMNKKENELNNLQQAYDFRSDDFSLSIN